MNLSQKLFFVTLNKSHNFFSRTFLRYNCLYEFSFSLINIFFSLWEGRRRRSSQKIYHERSFSTFDFFDSPTITERYFLLRVKKMENDRSRENCSLSLELSRSVVYILSLSRMLKKKENWKTHVAAFLF